MSGCVSPATAAASWRSEVRATLALGWPIILTNLAQMAIGITDTVMMGWLGPTQLAAGTLGANLYLGFYVVGVGLTLATAPLLAQSLGARRHAVRACRPVVRQGLWLAALYCLPAWTVLWHSRAILETLGQDPVLAEQAGAYGRALMWGLLPALGTVVLRSFIAARQRPRAGLVVTLAAVGLNALADWALIFGHGGMPALGVVGAGIASSLSNLFMLLTLLAFVLHDRDFRRFHLLGYWWRPDWPCLRALLRVGVPMGTAMGFEIAGFTAAALLMGLIDAASLAAHAIALQVASATFMVPMGLGQAATVRVGLAAGNADGNGVRRAGWTALALGVGFMAAMAVALTVWPQAVVAGFLDRGVPGNEVVAGRAEAFLRVAALFQMADAAQEDGDASLLRLKDNRRPMLCAGLGYWGIAMPAGIALAFAGGMGGLGIWIGLALGLGVVAALVIRRWSRRFRLGLIPDRR